MSEYREVVDKKRDAMLDTLLECIENNPVPWQKGWVSVFGGLTSSGYPYNAKTGKPYNGINALYLAVIEGRRGYGDARWATYNQIQELGANVRKGEKGSDIFFWTQYDKATKKPFDRRSVEGMAEEEVKEYLNENVRPVLKNYTVFNAAQCDNFPKAETTKLVEPPKTTGESLESAEKIIRNSAAPVRYDGGNNAFYSTFTDDIHLPKVDAFKTMNDYYATALHEIAHSTGHESRLNRDLSGSFGSEKYAIEELRAELTSVFMQTDLGIELGAAEITNHSAYLKSWLSVVKEDRNVFYKAAADASKATEYIRKNYLDKAEEAVSSEAPADATSARLVSSNEAPLGSTEVASAQAVADGVAAIEGSAIENATGVSSIKNIDRAARRAMRLKKLEANVPATMKELSNWCAFNYYKDADGEYKKKIWNCNAEGKSWAKCNDSTTWASFDKAISFARKNACDGLSFALSKDSGIFCIDLDDCKIDGKYTPLAWGVYNSAKNTYIERSVSGSGLHVFGRKAGDVDFSALGNKNADGTLEFYDENRFISMTGDIFMKSHRSLTTFSASDKLLTATAEHLPLKSQLRRPEKTFVNSESDSAVIARIRRSKKADEFNRLYAGENVCGDWSRSDMKLLNILGFFTNCDEAQMRRIFETSGLMRDNKSKGYLDRSIAKAVDTLYQQPKNNNMPKGTPRGGGKSLG